MMIYGYTEHHPSLGIPPKPSRHSCNCIHMLIIMIMLDDGDDHSFIHLLIIIMIGPPWESHPSPRATAVTVSIC